MFGLSKSPPADAALEAGAGSDPRRSALLFERLKTGLKKTRGSLGEGLSALFAGPAVMAEDLREELETRLLLADVGVDAVSALMESLSQDLERGQHGDPIALRDALKARLLDILKPCEQPLVIPANLAKPYVILMVGVNGVGKTTTIGKMARRFLDEGRTLTLAAGDTFRAAAIEQLQIWGERNQVPVVAQRSGADSASVIYDAYQSALARQADILIADTAGRLHNKDNLMRELEKVARVLNKLDADLPQEIMLILDAGTGQNGLLQAERFADAVPVSSLSLTKLDGTAKGGIIFAIAKRFALPIRFIGIGEQAEDLRPFAAEEFIAALFAEEAPATTQ